MSVDFDVLTRVYLQAYEAGKQDAKAAQASGKYAIMTLSMAQKLPDIKFSALLGYSEGWNDQEILTK